MLDPSRIIRKVLEAIGPRELERAKASVGSMTLRRAMRLIIEESEARANLFIPHFWAVYYHDGHGSISPRNARKLVFFDDPNDDPRLNGGVSPERASSLRRLTKAQYIEGLVQNQRRAAAGGRPFMYVVDRVGPQSPKPFFNQLKNGAADRAAPVILREFEAELLRQIDRDPETRGETGSAEFRL
jgi:hypothetical protein